MIMNRHERRLKASAQTVGTLIDQLASQNDVLWPHHRRWFPMRFDRPLQIGASGGHGPIRYVIEQYTPSQKIGFRLTAPQGLIGTHGFYLEPISANQTRLVHVLEVELEGSMWFAWTFLYCPMHNALVEDALDNGQILFEPNIKRKTWSWYVKSLVFVMNLIRQRNGQLEK